MLVKHWNLTLQKQKYRILSGNVYNSNLFADGIEIHTSTVEKVVMDEKDKELIFYTYSGSEYHAAFEDMETVDGLMKSNTCKTLENFLNEKEIETIVAYQQQRTKEKENDLNQELKNGTIYLDIERGIIQDAYVKYENQVMELKKDFDNETFYENLLGHFYLSETYIFHHSPEISCLMSFEEVKNGEIDISHISDKINRMIIQNEGPDEFCINDIFYTTGKLEEDLESIKETIRNREQEKEK